MAVRFNASGQEYTRVLTLGATAAFSVSCWVKISVDQNDISGIWSLDDGNSAGFGNGYLATGVDGTTLEYNSGGSTLATRALTVGTWYYAAVSVNGANGTLLTRALGDTSFTVSTWTIGPASFTATNWRLGKPVYANRWLNGSVAAVKMWQATLTQAELEAEAWQYLPQRTTNLGLWHPLTRPEAVDYSGLGRTLSGGAGVATEDGPGIPWRQGRRKMRTPLSVPAEATPGPVNGTWSVPAPGVSLGTSAAPGPVNTAWSVPTPSIYTGEPVTSAEPAAVRGTWAVPTPAVEAFKNVTITPAPVMAAWSVPAPTVTVPINPGDDLGSPRMISYNGFVVGGPDNIYRLADLIGGPVDLPPIDNGNVDSANGDGADSGRKVPRARILEAIINIKCPRDEITQAAYAFADALALAQADEELPIAIRLDDEIRVIYGTITGRVAPMGKNWFNGFVKAAVQWTCSKPAWVGRELLSATIADGATVGVYNAGSRAAKPFVRVPGPANGPELSIEYVLPDGTEDELLIGFDLEIGADETLIIDPALNSAAIGETSTMRYLTNVSNVPVPDWLFGPGSSWVTYTTQEGGAPAATVLWRHTRV